MSSPRTRARRSSGSPNQARFHASAWRAVSSSMRGRLAATRIGMSGRAGGRRTALRAWTYVPSTSARPVRIRSRMIVNASSNRPTLWSVGNPNASYSGSCQPAADAEDQPAAADVVQGRGHLGEHPRVAERRAHDERAELHALGRVGDGARIVHASWRPLSARPRTGTGDGRRSRANRVRPPRPRRRSPGSSSTGASSRHAPLRSAGRPRSASGRAAVDYFSASARACSSSGSRVV